ncbi:MAG: cysteinyl-tRNA synthetase, partial [Nitrobacter vulgaris]|nr:cysteinyl-tRNA synthetase [Nitrobacter vulgaris]
KNPADFVLWKLSSDNEPGWDSPWGRGRPGWHIECSAMSAAFLGEVFDIHGGGLDLIFPHHENEIAQSRCAHGTHTMANYWMHNGFLQVEGEKMSKSLGNFFTINELLTTEKFGGRQWPGEVLRLAMLKTHYRSPIDWTVQGLQEAEKMLDRWYDVIGDAAAGEISAEVLDALGDDMNMPKVISELHRLAHPAVAGEMMIGLTSMGQSPAPEMLKASANILGLLTLTGAQWRSRRTEGHGVDGDAVEAFIRARAEARARKDFKESDRIRDELAAMGVALKDGKDADGKPVTTWEIAR